MTECVHMEESTESEQIGWAYGDWTADTQDMCEWLESYDKACSDAMPLELLAEELGVRYTKIDLQNPEAFQRRLDNVKEKVELAKSMACELEVPYTERDLCYVNSFLTQLFGIKRANKLALRMGVGKLDFTVKTQTVQEYLADEDSM